MAAPLPVAAYGIALARELDAHLARPDVPAVDTLYFGGGTPSRTPELIGDVLARLRDRLVPGVEVHPADAAPTLLMQLRDLGVTRVSLGVETLDSALLHRLGRHYTPDAALAAVRAARATGFECVDVNLMHGIRGQDPDAANADAERLLHEGIDQLSAYPRFGFAHTAIKVDGVFWFNTFDVPAYIACEAPRPALALEVGERLRRLHWLYWALLGTPAAGALFAQLHRHAVDTVHG